MRIKKLLLPIMMIAFVLTSTIAFAASISISASKASGKVNTNERVVYTITGGDTYIQNVNATIYKVENGTETKLYGGSKTEGSNVKTVNLNFDMPKEPYANVRVKVSANNNAVTKSYDYTMDTSTTITVTPAKTSGELTKGSTLDIVTTSSTSGIGLKNVTVKMEDITGAVIKNVSWDIEPEYGNHCSKHTGTINVPNGDYGKVKMTVIVKDFGGNTTTKTFEYTIGKQLNVTNNLTITADPTSGAKIAKGSKVKFTSTSSNTKVGTRKMEVSIYRNDEFVETKTAESKEVLGNNPFNYSITFNTPGSYKCIVKATDVIGGVKTETFYYTIEDDGTPVTPTNYKVTVSFDPETRSNVEVGDYVRIAAKSAVNSDKVVSVKYTMYDDENDKISTKTVSGSTTNVYVDVLIPDEDTDYVTITATATTQSGATDTQTAKYFLDGSGDDDDDADDTIYEGVINPDLDDLAIDLWTVKNQRLYELEDEDIEFVAYYYNFEKTSKKNVVIDIEIPDGFKVKAKSTAYGSASVNKDNTKITYKVGTVPGKELREVRFTLIAKDDDLSETAQNIKAIIYSNNDDEEDTSTQRIYIYETGEKGSRRAFVTGYTDGTFRPDRNITRQEVAAMMARAFNYAAKTVSKTFTDVKTTSWSYRYVVGCANNNVIKGYTDGSFRPLNNITRAELYAMTFRSMEIDEEEKPLFVPKAYKKATAWDTPYVAGLERLRMIDDMDDLDKDEKATRAEVVYLISRVQFRNTSSFKVGYYTDVKASYWNAKDIEAASYNYTFKRTSSGKETVTQGTTFLESDSNYIR